MKKLFAKFFVVILFGCAISDPNKFENFEAIKGNLNGYPEIDKQGRLLVSIKNVDKAILLILKPKKNSTITTDILQSLHNYPIEKEVVLYGRRLEGPIDEYVYGIDYEASYIWFYNSKFKKFMLIKVDYSKGAVDSLKEIDMKSVMSIIIDWVKKLI